MLKSKAYYNLENSTKQFRDMLWVYKQQQYSKIKERETIQMILDLKKRQVEQRETDEEYLFNEMKENARLEQEMQNMFGVKTTTTKPKKVIGNIQRKIREMTKIRKDKLVNRSTNNNISDNKIKVVDQKILLPLIFPHEKKRSLDIKKPTIKTNRDKVNYNNDFIQNLKLDRNNQKDYLQTLDVIRDEFRGLSNSFGDYFEQERKEMKKTERKFEILQYKANNL